MTEFRIEKDSLGEVKVPRGCAVCGADAAGPGEFPDHGHETAASIRLEHHADQTRSGRSEYGAGLA